VSLPIGIVGLPNVGKSHLVQRADQGRQPREDKTAQPDFPMAVDSRDDLIRYFTLTRADVAFLDPGRGQGPADRLGLAVALAILPWLGFVPDEVRAAPPAAVARLAQQLGLDPAVRAGYGQRAHTRSDHVRLVAGCGAARPTVALVSSPLMLLPEPVAVRAWRGEVRRAGGQARDGDRAARARPQRLMVLIARSLARGAFGAHHDLIGPQTIRSTETPVAGQAASPGYWHRYSTPRN
jgi:Domain of unknown function (DUF4158)